MHIERDDTCSADATSVHLHRSGGSTKQIEKNRKKSRLPHCALRVCTVGLVLLFNHMELVLCDTRGHCMICEQKKRGLKLDCKKFRILFTQNLLMLGPLVF